MINNEYSYNLKNYKLNENEVLIKVDRTTTVGNPFIMHNESERDEVCDKYDEYFNNIVIKDIRKRHKIYGLSQIHL